MPKVGDRLVLEYRKSPKTFQRFHCRIVEIRDRALLVDSPINEKKKKQHFSWMGRLLLRCLLKTSRCIVLRQRLLNVLKEKS
ncbi:hypothetical protein QS257_10630 [Terrilactibacillus sp. S3-3]|nr:hypothetical protein QS257_10630 [Terrilactibacillus sp. S3-3]